LLWASETFLQTEDLTFDPALNPPGPWVAVARNPDGAESEPYPFTVDPAPPPFLTALDPADGRLGSEVTLEARGLGFFGAPQLLLAPEQDPTRVFGPLPLALVDPSRLLTEPFGLDPATLSAGRHLVWVENPDGAESNRLPFRVVE